MAEVRNLQASYSLPNSVLLFSPFRPMSARTKLLFASAGRLSRCHQYQHSYEQNGLAKKSCWRRGNSSGKTWRWSSHVTSFRGLSYIQGGPKADIQYIV